jgi:hypothetical protein
VKYRHTISNQSSPSRQILNAEIHQTGFRIGNFLLDTYPESFDALRYEATDIRLGNGFLPASPENELQHVSPEVPPFAVDRDEATRAQTEADATDLPVHRPSTIIYEASG